MCDAARSRRLGPRSMHQKAKRPWQVYRGVSMINWAEIITIYTYADHPRRCNLSAWVTWALEPSAGASLGSNNDAVPRSA